MRKEIVLVLALIFTQSAFGQMSNDHYWLLNQKVSVVAKLESILLGDAGQYYIFKCQNGEELNIAWWDIAEEQSRAIQEKVDSEDQIGNCFELKLRCVKRKELSYEGYQAGMVPTGKVEVDWELYRIDTADCR